MVDSSLKLSENAKLQRLLQNFAARLNARKLKARCCLRNCTLSTFQKIYRSKQKHDTCGVFGKIRDRALAHAKPQQKKKKEKCEACSRFSLSFPLRVSCFHAQPPLLTLVGFAKRKQVFLRLLRSHASIASRLSSCSAPCLMILHSRTSRWRSLVLAPQTGSSRPILELPRSQALR